MLRMGTATMGATSRRRGNGPGNEGRAADGQEQRERRPAEWAAEQRVKNESSDERPRDPPVDPAAMVQTTPPTRTGCGAASPTAMYGTSVASKSAMTVGADRSEEKAHVTAIGPRRAEGSRAKLEPSRRRAVGTAASLAKYPTSARTQRSRWRTGMTSALTARNSWPRRRLT